MDYTKTTWVDDDGSSTTGTDFTAARMNNIEDGIADAIAHNRVGALSSRPAAAAGNKNWLWIATDTDGTGGLYVSDGSTWTKMALGTLTATATRFGTAGEIRSGANASVLSDNYDSIIDRCIDTAKPVWRMVLDRVSDVMYWQRAPATAGSPAWTSLIAVSSSSIQPVLPVRFGTGGNLQSPSADNAKLMSNYDPASDRLIDTSKSAWQIVAGTAGDVFSVWRAPATAGVPVWVQVFSYDSANNVRFGFGGNLNSFTQPYVLLSANYNSATDRLIDTSRPCWAIELDGRSGQDRLRLKRAAATAGSPSFVNVLFVDSAGRARDQNSMALDSTPGFYGDGSDGAFTADGAAAMPGATRSGSVYTLTRDVYFTNLTVNSGVTIVSSGYRVFVSGTLAGAGTINANGGAASGRTGGTVAGQGSVQAGWGSGGAGGNGAANGAASLTVPRIGGGGGGGSGGAGSNGFTAGAATTPNAIPGGVRRTAPDMIFPIAIDTNFASLFIGGGGAGGGGGGSSTASATGGGGGGAAGVLIVAARILAGTVAFEAKGGAGAAGTLNGGGGGGGGGGLIHLIYGEKTDWTGTTSVVGGAAGAGNGTGVAGTAGSAGNVIQLAA